MQQRQILTKELETLTNEFETLCAELVEHPECVRRLCSAKTTLQQLCAVRQQLAQLPAATSRT